MFDYYDIHDEVLLHTKQPQGVDVVFFHREQCMLAGRVLEAKLCQIEILNGMTIILKWN